MWQAPSSRDFYDNPAAEGGAADEFGQLGPAPFFLADHRKILKRKELLSFSSALPPQNLGNTALTRKIFNNKDLHADEGSPKIDDFSSGDRKLLIPGLLPRLPPDVSAQNIVKEGLTRKIFQNKRLAQSFGHGPRSN